MSLGYVLELEGWDSWLNDHERLSSIVKKFMYNHKNAQIDTQVLIGPNRDEIYYLIQIDEQGDTEEDEPGYWI
jgi:hypothetical protein